VLCVVRPASRRGSPDGWSQADSRPRPATCQRPLTACLSAPEPAGSERPESPGYGSGRHHPARGCGEGGRMRGWQHVRPRER
jgi:hypothetical protein